MDISRSFLLTGAIYLITGILLGGYMGATGDHGLAVLHGHINLLGFTLMTVFGVVYRTFPALLEGPMAKAHFWLHQMGSLALLLGLFFLLSGRGPGAAVGPLMPLAEAAILLGTLLFTANLWRRAR